MIKKKKKEQAKEVVSLRKSFAKLLEFLKPEWGPLVVAAVFTLFDTAVILMWPQLIRIIIDKSILEKDIEAIDEAAILIIIITLTGMVLGFNKMRILQSTGERISASLRDKLFGKIITQDVTFFNLNKTGELINRLASDTTAIKQAITNNIVSIAQNAFGLIGVILGMVYASISLTLVILMLIPVLSVVLALYAKIIARHAKNYQDKLALAGHNAQEAISSVETACSFAREEYHIEKYRKSVLKALQVAYRRIFHQSVYLSAFDMQRGLIYLIVLWYGGRLTIAGEMTIGDLTSYLLYTAYLSGYVSGLSRIWSSLMQAIGISDKVFRLLDKQPIINLDQGDEPEEFEGRINFEMVNFSYPTRPEMQVLTELTFSIKPAEVIALVGPSGSGKSTIATLINRFYDPDYGNVLLDRVNVKELNPFWLRRQIAMVAQEPTLFALSIKENIRYGRLDATDSEVERAAKSANAHKFIVQFPDAYDTIVGERGAQLSGGQKQRIAIARAILKNPRILILDEATSALDSESEHLVQEALDSLMQNRTTVVIAHRLSTVKAANRIIVMEHGRIVQSGPHERLIKFQHGLYRRLVDRQFVSDESPDEALTQ